MRDIRNKEFHFFGRLGLTLLAFVIAGLFSTLLHFASGLFIGLAAGVALLSLGTLPLIPDRYMGGGKFVLTLAALCAGALFGFIFLHWLAALFYVLGVLVVCIFSLAVNS